MARRKTIGSSPLDTVIPAPASPLAEKPPVLPRSVKERLTVHLSVELIERVKNAVYWTPGLTLAELAEEAFAITVGRREMAQGGAFPQRRGELKGGRPLK